MDFLRNKPQYSSGPTVSTSKPTTLLGGILGGRPNYLGQGTGQRGDVYPPVTTEVPCPQLGIPGARGEEGARGKVPVSINVPQGAQNYVAFAGQAYGAGQGSDLRPIGAQVVGLGGPSFGRVQGTQLAFTVEWMLLPDTDRVQAGDNKAALTVLFY